MGAMSGFAALPYSYTSAEALHVPSVSVCGRCRGGALELSTDATNKTAPCNKGNCARCQNVH